jgi:hypothetical protein
MAGGGVRLFVLNRRAPGTLKGIEQSLEASLVESEEPASDVERGARVGLAYPPIPDAASTG